MNTVIHNTQARAIFIPPCVVNGTRYASQMLLPGQNDVPSEHFDAVKGKPGMSQYVKLGFLVDLGPGQAQSLPSGLDGMADADVRERLAAIEDANVLIDLRDRTTSSTLRDLINDRIRELTSPDTDPPAAPTPPALKKRGRPRKAAPAEPSAPSEPPPDAE